MYKQLLQNARTLLRSDSLLGVIFLMTLSIPLAFTIYTRENFETIKYSLWLVLFGCVLFCIAWPGKIYGTKRLSVSALLLLGAFTVFAIVSVFVSPDKINSVFGFYYRFSNGLLFYILWAGTILTLMVKGNKDFLVLLLKVLVLDALIISVLAILQTQGIAYYEGLDMAGGVWCSSPVGKTIFFLIVFAPPFSFVFFFLFVVKKIFAKK